MGPGLMVMNFREGSGLVDATKVDALPGQERHKGVNSHGFFVNGRKRQVKDQ
jgi:hypothetical protein